MDLEKPASYNDNYKIKAKLYEGMEYYFTKVIAPEGTHVHTRIPLI